MISTGKWVNSINKEVAPMGKALKEEHQSKLENDRKSMENRKIAW